MFKCPHFPQCPCLQDSLNWPTKHSCGCFKMFAPAMQINPSRGQKLNFGQLVQQLLLECGTAGTPSGRPYPTPPLGGVSIPQQAEHMATNSGRRFLFVCLQTRREKRIEHGVWNVVGWCPAPRTKGEKDEGCSACTRPISWIYGSSEWQLWKLRWQQKWRPAAELHLGKNKTGAMKIAFRKACEESNSLELSKIVFLEL